MALLEIENLSVAFPSQNGVMHAVDGVSLSLEEGEVLGIVGESGSGKSVTMMALMGLVAYPGRVSAVADSSAAPPRLYAAASDGRDDAQVGVLPNTSTGSTPFCSASATYLSSRLKFH